MQIIDTHVHYGKTDKINMTLEDICFLVKQRKIDVAIISSIENIENFKAFIFKDGLKRNTCLLDAIKDVEGLYMQYWIRPKTECMNNRIASFIENNRDKVLGLKIHPFLSKLCITDKRIKPYLDYAQQNLLPVSVHTAKGYECETRYLAKVCEDYPLVNFIAVHMDLGTDHKEAVSLVNKIPNLYGDVSWITYQDYLNLGVSKSKVLFGSDIPINMETAYDFYNDYFVHENEEEKLMHENALKLFFSR